MKKLGKKNSPEITTEAKSEIQELFDELFVGNLNSEITKVTSKSTETSEEISIIKKLSKDHFSVLADKMESIQESLICLGEKDDWGEESIISFLNTIAKIITECRFIVENRTICLDSEWNGGSLEEYIVRVESQNNNIIRCIEGIHKEDVGNKIEKLYNEIKQIDGIIGKLSIIENNLDNVLDYFGNDGTVEKILLVQNCVKSEIGIIGENLKSALLNIEKNKVEITEKLKENETEMIKLSQSLDDISRKIDSQTQCVNNTISENKRKFDLQLKYMATGIAVSLALNIILIIMTIV